MTHNRDQRDSILCASNVPTVMTWTTGKETFYWMRVWEVNQVPHKAGKLVLGFAESLLEGFDPSHYSGLLPAQDKKELL